MATPSKPALTKQLRDDYGVEPPEGASSQELQDLVKKMKRLPADPGALAKKTTAVNAPSPLGNASPPPMRSAAPLASLRPTTPATVAPTIEVPAPAVAPQPVLLSDRERRPHDPFAGC